MGVAVLGQGSLTKVYSSISDQAKVVDIYLKLDADFDRHVLDGFVTLTVEKVDKAATHVVSWPLSC